jgi:hypothetical protein
MRGVNATNGRPSAIKGAGQYCAVRRRARKLHSSSLDVEHTSGKLPAMTRTPHTTVTAIAIAARAFAWGISRGAHFSGPVSGMLPPLY